MTPVLLPVRVGRAPRYPGGWPVTAQELLWITMSESVVNFFFFTFQGFSIFFIKSKRFDKVSMSVIGENYPGAKNVIFSYAELAISIYACIWYPLRTVYFWEIPSFWTKK